LIHFIQQQLAFFDAIHVQLVVEQVFWHWVLPELFKIENHNMVPIYQNYILWWKLCNTAVKKYYILLNILLCELELKISFIDDKLTLQCLTLSRVNASWYRIMLLDHIMLFYGSCK
jgi:hypothetical protein